MKINYQDHKTRVYVSDFVTCIFSSTCCLLQWDKITKQDIISSRPKYENVNVSSREWTDVRESMGKGEGTGWTNVRESVGKGVGTGMD